MLKNRVVLLACFITILVLLPATLLQAQESDLAKATQNPVADLATFPLQFNWFSGGDLGDRTLYLLNFQPVLPLPINDKWNVISRTVVPILNVPLPNGARAEGIGDIQAQFYFTPAKTGGLIWGVGPVFSLPTATNDAVNTGQFAIGPTAVVLKMTGPWVIGLLANQLWQFAGNTTGPDLNTFVTQPFINFNFQRGWSIAFAPLITANRSAASGEEWTVPIGFGLSKVAAVGKQPVNLSLQYYNNVERPTGAGEHQVRMIFAFLFPKPRKQ